MLSFFCIFVFFVIFKLLIDTGIHQHTKIMLNFKYNMTSLLIS